MEALVLIFGGLVAGIVTPILLLIGELVSSLLTAGVCFLIPDKPNHAAFDRAAKIISAALGVLALLTLSGLWIVNQFFFSEAVNHVFGMVEERSGIATTCHRVGGSLFQGDVELEGCKIRRADDEVTSFDLELEKLLMDVSVLSLWGTPEIELAAIDGLHGQIIHRRDSSEPDDVSQVSKPRRAFVISRLDVSNVGIDISGTNRNGNTYELPVSIDHISSQPLRSRLALFDLLFRSNAAGSIAGAPFQITTAPIKDGRETTWSAQGIPLALFGTIAGRPLSWFKSGSMDFQVDDSWQLGDEFGIEMDWRLSLRDVEVEAPPGTSAAARLTAAPVVRYVNGLGDDIPLEFQLAISEGAFEHKMSLAAAGLWDALGESITAALKRTGGAIDLEFGSEGTGKVGVRAVLDRFRKSEDSEED